MELSGEGKSVSKNRGRAKNLMQEATEDAGLSARTSRSWQCPHQSGARNQDTGEF